MSDLTTIDIEPFPKKLYEQLVASGVDVVTLRFSGGSDEGCLDVEFERHTEIKDLPQLTDAVEKWAWSVYSYCGAGWGRVEFGNDISYNLKTMMAAQCSWTREWGDTDEEDDLREKDSETEPVRLVVEPLTELTVASIIQRMQEIPPDTTVPAIIQIIHDMQQELREEVE